MRKRAASPSSPTRGRPLPAVFASAESRAKKAAVAAAAADNDDIAESESVESADSDDSIAAVALPRALSASEIHAKNVESLSNGYYYRPDVLKSLGIPDELPLTRGRRQEHVANIVAGGGAMLSPPSKAASSPALPARAKVAPVAATPLSPVQAKAAAPVSSGRAGAAASSPAPKPAAVPASKRASIDGIALDVPSVRLRGPSGAFISARSQSVAQASDPKKTPAAAGPAPVAKPKKTASTVKAVHGMDDKEEFYVVSFSDFPSTLMWKAKDAVKKSPGGPEAIAAFKARYSMKDVFSLPEY